ncbi:MAG: hypothetical protein ACFB0B_08030 [Thermonemataceae bacterium]
MGLWWKYILVYLWATTKFVVAPITGYLAGLGWLENALLTVAGMMTTLITISYIGEQIRDYLVHKRRGSGRRRRVFTRRNRFIVRVWKGFGIYGICFLTPVLFSPIVGSILAVSFERDKKKLWLVMLVASAFWAFLLSISLQVGGDSVLMLIE